MVKGVEDGVEQAHGRYRLQALIALRGGKSVAASAANTKRADTIRIYARVAFQEIHRGVHIVNTVRGLICLHGSPVLAPWYAASAATVM